MDAPLTTFGQHIIGDSKMIVMKPGQRTALGVTVQNLTGRTIASAGKYPVLLSYKWFEGDRMLPIDGDRTPLVRQLAHRQALTMFAGVTAPPQPGLRLTLRFSLIQEGVAWFLSHNAPTLDIPVQLEQ
jgi:hypothetical protein